METPEHIVKEVLEPGETILWSGAPDMKSAVKDRPKAKRGMFVTAMFVFAFGAVFYQSYKTEFEQRQLDFADIPGLISESLVDSNILVIVIIGVMALLLLFRLFKVDIGSSLTRHFSSQTYAITNRRLLVLEKGTPLKTDDGYASYAPGDIVNLELREREGGYGDVIFGRNRTGTTGSTRSSPTALQIERSYIGFKAQPNAQDLMRRIETWQRDANDEAEKKLAEFLKRDAGEGVARLVENTELGLRLTVPRQWQLEVRKKKKPFGKTFIDIEKWKDLDQGSDWNVVKVTGSKLYQIQVESFKTAPTAEYKDISGGGLIEMVTGKIVNSSSDFKMAGLGGFMVERQLAATTNHKAGVALIEGSVNSSQTIILQEPDRQVVINILWASDSQRSKAVLDKILDSIELS